MQGDVAVEDRNADSSGLEGGRAYGSDMNSENKSSSARMATKMLNLMIHLVHYHTVSCTSIMIAAQLEQKIYLS